MLEAGARLCNDEAQRVALASCQWDIANGDADSLEVATRDKERCFRPAFIGRMPMPH